MVVINTVVKHFFSQQEIWFYDGSMITQKDKNLFYQSINKPTGSYFQFKEFDTIVIFLHNSNDEILAGISRTFKYHIRKAGKLNIKFQNIELKNEMIRFYLNSYNTFAKRKKLLQFPEQRVNALVKNEKLTLTSVQKDGETVTLHAYLHDDKRVRLLTSHSLSLIEDDTTIGYCNKFHHWQDILYFKNLGFEWYDFGGVSRDKTDGRNYFKRSFGGEQQTFYHFIKCKGIARAWFTLRGLYDRFS